MSELIGFIGLGNMGLPMATNLVEAGYTLQVYNRTPQKAQPLVEKGAKLKNTSGEVVKSKGVVITMLPNDRIVEEVVFSENGILEQLGDESIHLSMSTLSPATAEKLTRAHEKKGAYYIAAPVLGRPDVAEAGKLNICLSGSSIAKKRVQPLLKVLADKVYDFGEKAEAANVVKLAVNFAIAAAMEAMAEAYTLAEKNGIERTQIGKLFTETMFACPGYQSYSEAIAKHEYEPAGFKLSLGLKDIGLALQTAKESQMPMPLASLVHQHLLGAVAKDRGNIDWAGLALEVSEAAGFKQVKNNIS